MGKTDFQLFEAWARAKGHYPVVAAIERFKKMRGSRNGDEPILDAATMALVDKLQDED
jgi:hypothetical protein